MNDQETKEQEVVERESAETTSEGLDNEENQESGKFSIWAGIGIAVAVVGLAVLFFVANTSGDAVSSGGISGGTTTSEGTISSTVSELIMPLGAATDGVITVPWKNAHWTSGLLHRGLVLSDSSFESTTPDLAKSLEISEDGLTYTIHLKEGIKWSDGVDLTMDDVLFSLNWILLAESVNGLYTTAFLNIEGAVEYQENPSVGLAGVTTDGNVLTIQLAIPYPAFEQVLGQFTIVPKHILEETDMVLINDNLDYWRDPVVCGMYMVDEVELEVDVSAVVTLVHNEYYEGVQPQIDKIITTSDHTSLDYYSTNNIEEIINLRNIKGFEEYQIDVLFYRYFIFNMSGVDGVRNTAMEDPLVRKAIGYAINREELLRSVYLNTGSIIDSGVPMSHSAYVGTDTDVEYDPEKAKELLAQSSYDLSRPLRVTYYYSDDVSIAFMEGIKSNLQDVGFTVDLFKVDAGSELYNEREYDLGYKGLSAFSLLEWYAEYDDDNANFKNIFGGTTEFEPYINALSSEVDADEIDKILSDLQYLEDEKYFKLPLFTSNHSVFINVNRVEVPEDIVFGNTFYRQDVRFEEWIIK